MGAEGVVENGGIINRLGTFNIALAAAAHNKPFYVAAESYKVISSCNQGAASEDDMWSAVLTHCSAVCKAVPPEPARLPSGAKAFGLWPAHAAFSED